jgi:hypothetical protein
MDTKLAPSFWSDPAFDSADSQVLLAVIWLNTNQSLDILGFAEISPRTFEFQTRMPFAVLERACQALGKGLVREGNSYWLRYFVRDQIGAGISLAKNHMRKPLMRALSVIRSADLRTAIQEEYPELKDDYALPTGRACQGLHDVVTGLDDSLKPSPRATQGVSDGLQAPEQSRAEQNREEQSRAEQSQGGVGDGKSARRAGSTRPDQHPEPMRARMLALGEVFRRRPDSVWSDAEKKALGQAGLLELDQEDFDDQLGAMRAFYRATVPPAKQQTFWRRTTLPILLNNWPSELDKARAWRRESGGEGDGVRKIA